MLLGIPLEIVLTVIIRKKPMGKVGKKPQIPCKNSFCKQLNPKELLLPLKPENTIVACPDNRPFLDIVTVGYRIWAEPWPPPKWLHVVWKIKETGTLRNECCVLLWWVGQDLVSWPSWKEEQSRVWTNLSTSHPGQPCVAGVNGMHSSM